MAAQSSGPHPDAIGDLVIEVAELRRRVVSLEKRLGVTGEGQVASIAALSPLPAMAGLDLTHGIVPVLGRMLVVIAGAYVLRALTEWGVLPVALGVTLGLAYGLTWLVLAARSTAASKIVSVVNCCTSILIVGPLIWEATMHLKVLSSSASAAVLAGFALFAIALTWQTGFRIIVTIACTFSIGMGIALLLARDDILPFSTGLLVIAAGSEFAAWRGRPPGARALAAISAACSVLLFSWLISGPHGMPDSWVPASPASVLAAQIALAFIYIATAAIQTVARRRTLSFAEMFQTSAALVTGIGGMVWVFHERQVMMLGMGLVALAGGIACYAISFRMFEQDNKWNFRAWAAFGLFLVLAGISLPFSRAGFWVLCCASSVVCCWTARIFRLPTLGLHGAVYLTVGSAAAGATGQSLQVLFGGSGAITWGVSMAVIAAGTLSWIAIARIAAEGIGQWRNRVSSLVVAVHLTWITAGLISSAAFAIWRMVSDAQTIAPADTIATVILMGMSLALAGLARGWDRREFVWLLYALMAVCAYKLAVRDFRTERNIALVVSLLAYGGTLILLPGLLRNRAPSAE